jgi:hypothetical protein
MRATNDVTAPSRDQVNQRAPSTTQQPVTSTRGPDRTIRGPAACAKIPFLTLIEAQRNLVNLRDRYYEALADYFRRRASLERAIGGPLAPQPLAVSPDDGRNGAP